MPLMLESGLGTCIREVHNKIVQSAAAKTSLELKLEQGWQSKQALWLAGGF